MSCQHFFLGEAPCAQSKKNRQYDWQFFRQHRHCERDTGEKTIQPITTRYAIPKRNNTRKRQPNPGNAFYHPCDFVL